MVYNLVDPAGNIISQFNAGSQGEADTMAAPWGRAVFFSDPAPPPPPPVYNLVDPGGNVVSQFNAGSQAEADALAHPYGIAVLYPNDVPPLVDYPTTPPWKADPFLPGGASDALLPLPPLLTEDFVAPLVQPQMPAEHWDISIGDDGTITTGRVFPLRVVVDGRGRMVNSEDELSLALDNGGYIDQTGGLTNGSADSILMDVPPPSQAAAGGSLLPWLGLGLGLLILGGKRK